MKRFVIGDIHGAHKALIQCLDKSGFDKNNDLLISLGDMCDGWPEVDKVFDELLTVKNLVTILGNHDKWLLNWFRRGEEPSIWLMQGGIATLDSMRKRNNTVYKEMLENSRLYYLLDNSLFVHGGILTDRPVEQQDESTFLWDRTLIMTALGHSLKGEEISLTAFNMVYIGHTPTINFGTDEPILACDVCLMDTGAGWQGGRLTMMDIDTGTFYSSDRVDELYPHYKSR